MDVDSLMHLQTRLRHQHLRKSSGPRLRIALASRQRDARGFADTSITGPDAPALAPAFETAAPELLSLVGDHVLGRAPAGLDGTFQKSLDWVR